MERLTHVCENGKILFNPEGSPDHEGVQIISIALNKDYTALNQIAERLAEYENAEEAGLIWRLPFKVGETIFEIVSKCAANQVEPEECDAEITCTGCLFKRELVVVERTAKPHILMDAIFNERKLFATREEAEAALKMRKQPLRIKEDKA